MAELSPEALLPAAAAEDGGGVGEGARWVIAGADVEPPVPAAAAATATLRRNGLAHLCVEEPPPAPAPAAGAPQPPLIFTVRSLFATGGFAEAKVSGGFSWRVEVPGSLRGAVARLAALGSGEAVARDPGGEEPEGVAGLLAVLQHVGYLQ